jgi:hypothetical protein
MDAFVLSRDSVIPYLAGRGILPPDADATVAELPGGVSATVLAVRGRTLALVAKQALLRLKVEDEWTVKQCDSTPG